MGKLTEARKKANRKWVEANYYRVALTIPKAWESEIKQYAVDNNTTVNKLLNEVIAGLLGKEQGTNTSTTSDTTVSTLINTNTSINQDTNVSTEHNTNISTPSDTNTSTDKKRKEPPSFELVAEWDRLNKEGISFAKIADTPIGNGYHKTTISKAVANHNKDSEQDSENVKNIIDKLNAFASREEAAAYFNESDFTNDLLRVLAKHYSVPNHTRLNKQGLIDKLVETTVGAKLRFEAIYNTKVR